MADSVALATRSVAAEEPTITGLVSAGMIEGGAGDCVGTLAVGAAVVGVIVGVIGEAVVGVPEEETVEVPAEAAGITVGITAGAADVGGMDAPEGVLTAIAGMAGSAAFAGVGGKVGCALMGGLVGGGVLAAGSAGD